MRVPLVGAMALMVGVVSAQDPPRDAPPERAAATRGVRLEDLTWQEAEGRLTADTVVVIPLGAAAKEHGPHLKLRNDLTLADYLTRQTLESADVVVAPALTYHFYPAFLEYPGSTSLGLATARDMTADVVRSLARYGPRRFYVLNTGISTVRALEETVKLVAADGILLRYTSLDAKLEPAVKTVQQQPHGSHADEIETSMMLYIDAAAVDMTKAARDLAPRSTPMRFTRLRGGQGTYSPSGIWGDATLATREKGRVLVDALVRGILADIQETRRAPLPAPASGPAADAPRPPSGPPVPAGVRPPPGVCLPGDERAIRQLGDAFTLHWTNQDALALSQLWAPQGDIFHPDGYTERSREVIRQNRSQLFARKEYAGSRHPLTIPNIRCITQDVAIADGKWELRGMTDARGQIVPPINGLVTVVATRSQGSWLIEAYRYTVGQAAGIKR